MEKAIHIGSPSWARFEDWINNILGKYSHWTVVAELEDYKGISTSKFFEMKATLSYLVNNDTEKLKNIFTYDGWDTQYDQGRVSFEETDQGAIFHEILGTDARIFISRKETIGTYQSHWKLWPTFENYFDLRSDENGNLFDPYNREMVVEIPFPSERGPVRVRTDYLQDYLAARNMVLIRQHDHRRHWNDLINDLPEKEIDEIVKHETWGCYRLDVINSRASKNDRFSRIVAKDFITPFKKAGSVGAKTKKPLSVEDYPDFITSKGIDGEEIKQKPNPADILYPTYFSPKVLKRYYDEPSLYSVGFHAPGMGGVSFLDQWSFPIGRNSEGLIITWLGDLAKAGLPYEEIVHWRVHNVPPRGGMAMDFWNSQMMCDPPKEPSIESRLIDCKYHINNKFDSLGKLIWSPYKGPDKATEKILREPLFEEHAEFNEAITVLSRMFIEYLNIDLLRNELPVDLKEDSNGNKFGSIVLFSSWLVNFHGVSPEIAGKIKRALQNIQMLRSKAGVAHRFSDSSYQEAIRKLGLSGYVTAKLLFESVSVPLAEGLEELCIDLGIDDNLWWLKFREKED